MKTPVELYILENNKAEFELCGNQLAALMPSTWTYVWVDPQDLHKLACHLDENWGWEPEDLERYGNQDEIQSLFRQYFTSHLLESEFGDFETAQDVLS